MDLKIEDDSSSQSEGPQMMGAANDLKPMSDFPLILTEGGDDRLPLN